MQINMLPQAAAHGGPGVGHMTSAGNPWTVADAVGNDLVARGLATYTSLAGLLMVGTMLHITANAVADVISARLFNAANVTVVFDGAYTLTIASGAGLTGFPIQAPASGSAAVASDGTARVNGATSDKTLTAGGGYALLPDGLAANAYRLFGAGAA